MIRSVPAIAFVVLAAAIVWAAGQADIIESFARITDDPWGVVTLVDLYAGFAVVAVLIGLIEPRRWVTLLVVILIPFLGSLVPAAWLVARFPLVTRIGARGLG
jgi:hypothetical protein